MRKALKALLARVGYDIVRREHHPQVMLEGSVVGFEHEGRPVRWFVPRRFTMMGRVHFAGRFYEADELEAIARHVPKGGTMVDIGANFGNHTVFMGLFMAPDLVVSFEPAEEARRVLAVNVGLNDLAGRVRIEPVGLSNRRGTVGMDFEHPKNPGSFGISAAPGAVAVPVRTGDEMLDGLDVRFMKIDVERHEFEVLEGLAGTIARCRPHMIIEIFHENRPRFETWARDNGYVVVWEIMRHGDIYNLLLSPR